MTEDGKESEVGEDKELIPSNKDIEIPAEIGELIDEMGEEKFKRVISIVQREFYIHRGPLPDPKAFGQYETILPGAADRILTMAEKQQNHRMGIEKSVTDSDIQRANQGLILGFILFLLFAIGGFVLLFIGKDVQGYALLGTSFVGGVVNFIRVGRERMRQTQRNKETKSKQKRKKKKKKKKEKKGKKEKDS